MKIFVINTGSSTIKSSLFELDEIPLHYKKFLWEQTINWKEDSKSEIKTHIQALLKSLLEDKIISSLSDIDLVAHRLVHGGKEFSKATLITPEVKNKIKSLAILAPLHNPYELEGIDVMQELLKDIPQIAVFDTAFHKDLPREAKIYPGPYSWYEEGIQRYGFHGISFKYCADQAFKLLKHPSEKMIICHLGSGASLCALKKGKSVDTTMGFTPLEGVMMGSRSGSIDPGILLYLLQEGKTADDIAHTLYHESGLLGLSEKTADMKELLADNSAQVKLALEVYVHRLVSSIGALVATLNGLDTLIFTAGIGENAPLIRERACESLAYLNLQLDPVLNSNVVKKDSILSTPASKVTVLLIHTQEAFQIAKEAYEYKMT